MSTPDQAEGLPDGRADTTPTEPSLPIAAEQRRQLFRASGIVGSVRRVLKNSQSATDGSVDLNAATDCWCALDAANEMIEQVVGKLARLEGLEANTKTSKDEELSIAPTGATSLQERALEHMTRALRSVSALSGHPDVSDDYRLQLDEVLRGLDEGIDYLVPQPTRPSTDTEGRR